MRLKYGLGISVKTVKGAEDSRAPVNMGDLRRVSHEFNTTNSFTLIVGVWNKRNFSDNYEIKSCLSHNRKYILFKTIKC